MIVKLKILKFFMTSREIRRVAVIIISANDDASKTETDGTIEGWIRFETISTRGEGHLRINSNGLSLYFVYSCTCMNWSAMRKQKWDNSTKRRRTRHPQEPQKLVGEQTRWRSQPWTHETTVRCNYWWWPRWHRTRCSSTVRRLGVPTIIIEKSPKYGDSWRNRYKVCFI